VVVSVVGWAVGWVVGWAVGWVVCWVVDSMLLALLHGQPHRTTCQIHNPKQDLTRHPNNGWSLYGLWQAAQSAAPSDAAGDDEATAAQQKFQAAWASAEVQISSSCPALGRAFDL